MQLYCRQFIGPALDQPAGCSGIMAAIGTRIYEIGTLLRAGAAFVLRSDLGGRRVLDLHHVPVDHVEKRVRITGTVVGDCLVEDGVGCERTFRFR